MRLFSFSALRRAGRQLGCAPRESLPPAARWVRDHQRTLYLLSRMSTRPLHGRDLAPLRSFCAEWARAAGGPVRESALRHALQESGQPLSVRSLRLLPAALQYALLQRLCALLPDVIAQNRQWQAGRADAHQAREELSRTAAEVGAVITALLSVRELDGERLAQRLSPAAKALCGHPTWQAMDRESRGLYLTAADRLAHRLHLEEETLCRAALSLSEGQTGAAAEPGYYLLEDCRALRKSLGKRPGLSDRARIRLYFFLLLLGACISGAAGAFLLPWYGILPFLFTGCGLWHHLLERLSARLLPRRLLPRLRADRLPGNPRALVAVPTVLLNEKHALAMCRHLSVLYHANAQAPVDFLLLCDFSDADSPTLPQDAALQRAAAAGVDALRQTLGPRFYYLQRGRSADPINRRYAGRERKRGALLLLGRLLAGGAPQDPILYSTMPLDTFAHRYSQVITLDADTFLPAGTPEKLLGTLLHPLQRGRVTVIQPHMLTLPMHVRTRAQRLLGGRSGATGYGAAAASLYQDAFGRGSFMGKGIYDAAAFHAATTCLPAGRILSHDLIEGELAHAALAADIVCYDGHPQRVEGFLRRAHRWTRGDWQLIGFLFSRRLDLLSKLKIWDNLRRSLTPFFRMLTLILSSLTGAFLPFLLALLPLRGLPLLPADGLNRLDAACRALWRLTVTKRKLLEWTTAAQAEEGDLAVLRHALPPMLCGAVLLFSAARTAFWPGFALGVCWLAYPLTVHWLNGPLRVFAPLSPAQRAFLHSVARDTLSWFEKTVCPATAFLPPDNEQLSPHKGVALRTSPTNIGLYLLSLCAALRLDLLRADEVLTRMSRTLKTLEKLPTWHGIPYNWYDLTTLTPLPPRVVSSVDAGNYLLCLRAAAQAVRQLQIDTDVPARLDALCGRIMLQRLYDRGRRLFYISIAGDTGKPSAEHYDLLASESCLLSFAAICRGAVPEAHWWRLARPWAGGRPPLLLSWSGTMFEYLLPALLLPSWPDTLLAAARKGCVSAQRRAGRGGVFGISESGMNRFDADLNYGYRAFGVPALALDPYSAGDVYAPYAAALALSVSPDAACQSLRQMQVLGAYGDHGFYEALDHTRGEWQIVRSHMAHHQGMLLCAICNALCPDALSSLLLALPQVQAHLPLLNELPPRRAPRLPRPLRAVRDRQPDGPVRIKADSALPADALLLSGGGTSLLVNARGHSRLFQENISLTRFDPRIGALSGPQLYLTDAQGACLRLTGGAYTWLDGAARCALPHDAVRSEITLCVDPLTGAAVYRLRLRSLCRESRRYQAVFYLEPALCDQQEDQAHTAFSDLFLSVQPHQTGCLIRRNLREGGQRTLRIEAYAPCQLTDDRTQFLGREGSLQHPQGLSADWRLTGSASVCAALRVQVTLPPGGEETLCFVIGAKVPQTLSAALDAESLAATRAQVSRPLLGIVPADLPLLSRLTGALLYDRDAPRPARRADLWLYGISGDAPVLAIRAESEADTDALARLAHLFAALIENGAQADLLFLLPEEAGYTQPLHAFCQGLALPRAHICSGSIESLPGVLTLSAAQPLEAQLKKLPPVTPLPPASPGGALPALPRLAAWNGFGGFTAEGHYIVQGTAPAPWCHIVCSERFGTLLSEQGILYSYLDNSRLGRLTRPCQDSVQLVPSEEYFLLEGGKAWSLTRKPFCNAACRVLYEPGAAEYRCALPGLSAALTCFADAEHPCGGRLVSLRNTGGDTRSLTLLGAARFALGETGYGSCAQAGTGVVTTRGEGGVLAFFALRGAQTSTTEQSFFGFADAMRSLQPAPGSVGLLQTSLTLRPGESASLCFWLGGCEDEARLPALLDQLTPGRDRLARAAWRQRLDALRFYLPDRLMSGLLNGFLPYQIRASRLQMRAGFWQAGGAWGFRDQLQDMLALMYTEPERVRAHLLLCASRQYAEGDVQHWWHPNGAGVRTHISDDRLFLPYVIARYVHVSGDSTILDAHVPYLLSDPLSEDVRDRYETPEISSHTETLREHCLRAINSLRYGPHGIPLMDGGDWNDGMNEVRGESVWLGFFLMLVLRDFAPLCDRATQDAFDHRRIALHTALQSAWTGRWFLRAWYPDGRTLGAPDSDVPRIDLISQCFAAFAGMPRDQVKKALNAAWDALHREKEGVTLLLTPPFTPEEKAGYIGAYNPGARENGGQYTHALPWLMRALLMDGQTNRAWQLLGECLPYAHSDTPEKAAHYGVEPYVLAADIRPDGRGGWTWYTGSAAWLYDVVLRDFLGFDKKGGGVRLSPRLPTEWDEITLLYRYGGSRWQLTAARDQHYITLDGEKVTGAYVPLRDDGKAHEIRFPILN